MANNNFDVETGITVGGGNVAIDGTSGNITTTGNIIINTGAVSYSANSVTPKSYTDNFSIVFGL
jgi:hypothetical protein